MAGNDGQSAGLNNNLRQMIAVLESERQSLADLDADGLTEAAVSKESLCDALAGVASDDLDTEARALAETARNLNAVNRRVRNLLAANVARRLEVLGVTTDTYAAPRSALA